MKVFLIGAITVCGRIGPAGMGSGADRRLLERMRAETGAGLMGAGTLRVENPEMRGPAGRLPAGRIRAIITNSGEIKPFGKKLFAAGPPPVVFTGAEQASALARQLGDRAEVLVLPPAPGGLSLAAAIEKFAELGAESVLIEGGGRLNYAAFKQEIVDELCLTVTPLLSGDRTAVSLADGPAALGDPFLRLDLLSCSPAETGELFLRYAIRRR